MTRLLGRVSTRPNYESYSWGIKQSAFARAIYEAFFVLRIFSPLQWIKFYQRREKLSDKMPQAVKSTLEDKARKDFHAFYTEMYFLFCLAFAAIFWVAEWSAAKGHASGLLIHVLVWPAGLLLVESYVWLLYYSLVRPLIERGKLNLFDEAEYFVTLPVVLTAQLLYLSGFWHQSPLVAAEMLLNVLPDLTSQHLPWDNKVEAWQMLLAVATGQVYLVVVLANLIRVLPELHVRKRPNVTVIGCGDVVVKRIIPALKGIYSTRQIAVASDHISASRRKELRELGIHQYFDAGEVITENRRSLKGNAKPSKVEGEIVKWISGHSQFAIIATPTPSHMAYMLSLAAAGIKFAVEKPLVSTEAELAMIREPSFDELLQNSFVLGYYWLEKALPLNYLVTLRPGYRPILELRPNFSAEEIEEHTSALGRLTNLTIEFLEGPETEERYWSELRVNGGMVLETLIHPYTLMINLLRFSNRSQEEFSWQQGPHARWRKNCQRAEQIKAKHGHGISATYVEMEGKLTGGVSVQLRCGKYIVDAGFESRFLLAQFEHGWITCDLSEMTARVFAHGHAGGKAVLEVKNAVNTPSQVGPAAKEFVRYQQQIELFNVFASDGWNAVRLDDYPGQLDVLKALFALKRSMPLDDQIECDSDAKANGTWLTAEIMKNPASAPGDFKQII